MKAIIQFIILSIWYRNRPHKQQAECLRILGERAAVQRMYPLSHELYRIAQELEDGE